MGSLQAGCLAWRSRDKAPTFVESHPSQKYAKDGHPAHQNVGGVAFWAHVGGFVAGALLVKVFGERELRIRTRERDER